MKTVKLKEGFEVQLGTEHDYIEFIGEHSKVQRDVKDAVDYYAYEIRQRVKRNLMDHVEDYPHVVKVKAVRYVLRKGKPVFVEYFTSPKTAKFKKAFLKAFKSHPIYTKIQKEMKKNFVDNRVQKIKQNVWAINRLNKELADAGHGHVEVDVHTGRWMVKELEVKS